MTKLNFSFPSFLRKGVFQKKSVRLIFETLLVLIGLTLFALTLLIGRLAYGPINLDFLNPEIESALNIPESGIKGSLEHTQLAWHQWAHPFEIELVDVKLHLDQKPHEVHIDSIGISIRLPSLLMGELSPKALRFYRPQILLERDEEGKFLFGLGEADAADEFSFDELSTLITLDKSSPSLGIFNDLKVISIVDAHVEIKDDQANQVWQLPKSTLTLTRYKSGFFGEVFLRPQVGSDYLKITLSHTLGSERISFKAKFRNLAFSNLFESKENLVCKPNNELNNLDDIMNMLQCWNIPLNGRLKVAFNPSTLEIIKGSGEIDLEKGTLDLSMTKFHPLPISSGSLAFTLSKDKFNLQRFTALSTEMLLYLEGELDSSSILTLTNFFSTGQQLELRGKIEDLPLDHLGSLWPEELGPNAREWVIKNLKKGLIKEATISFRGHGEEQGFVIDDLRGDIEGVDSEVTYLDGLPPVENVHAHATFDSKGFDVKLHSGNYKSVQVKDAKAFIKGLDTDNESISLQLSVDGPLDEILEILNHKPLEYASSAGIDPKKVKGTGSATLKIDFPLLTDLQLKDVKLSANGTMKDVSLERKITDKQTAHLSNGNLSLNLTQDQMKISGKGIVNNFRSSITSEHYFTKQAPYKLQLKVEAATKFNDLKQFGFEENQYIHGSTNASIIYSLDQQDNGHLSVNLDITPSTLSFPPLEWQKNPGEKGEISFGLNFDNGNLTKIDQLKIVASPYTIKGDVSFDSQKDWTNIHLSEFRGPHSDTQATFKRSRKDTYEISFTGNSVNLENFLSYLDKQNSEVYKTPVNIIVQANVGRLRLGPDKFFDQVKTSAHLVLQGEERHWKKVNLRAQAGQGTAYKGDMAQVSGGILFDLETRSNNTQTLEVRANDAGRFLKNLSVYDNIDSGYLTIKAVRQGQGPFVGTFKMKSFEAQSVPLLARFAAVLSPIGIANLFSQKQTLFMERFACDFDYSDQSVVIRNGVGKSMSLGFTAQGKLDRSNQLFSLSGNIIPARFINSVLNNIPIIGDLLNGGKGEGLIAFAYTVQGPFSDPNVSINPLSALAPGFIRNLFQSSD